MIPTSPNQEQQPYGQRATVTSTKLHCEHIFIEIMALRCSRTPSLHPSNVDVLSCIRATSTPHFDHISSRSTYYSQSSHLGIAITATMGRAHRSTQPHSLLTSSCIISFPIYYRVGTTFSICSHMYQPILTIQASNLNHVLFYYPFSSPPIPSVIRQDVKLKLGLSKSADANGYT